MRSGRRRLRPGHESFARVMVHGSPVRAARASHAGTPRCRWHAGSAVRGAPQTAQTCTRRTERC